MAQHRLGRDADARTTLARLRDAMSRQPWSDDDESEMFADETIAMIDRTEPPLVEIARFADDSREAVEFAVFSPDGRRVLACGVDGTIRLWDRESRRLIRRLRGGRGTIDDRRVLAGRPPRPLRRRRQDRPALGRRIGQAGPRVPGAYRVGVPGRLLPRRPPGVFHQRRAGCLEGRLGLGRPRLGRGDGS